MNPMQLAQQGWHLVPWSNRRAKIRKPLVTGFLESKPSAKTVEGWHKTWPTCDWAVVPVDHMVVDIEMKNGLNGEAEWAELTAGQNDVAYGPIYKTFNGGRHLWFRVPAGFSLKGGVHLTPGIEVKCRNGTAHIAPSEGYVAITPLGAYDGVPECPEWLVDLWMGAGPRAAAKLQAGAKFAEGERHAGLCSYAGKLRNMGLEEEGIFSSLQGVRAERCENPESVTDDELRGIAKAYATKHADSFDLRVEQGETQALSVNAFVKQNKETVAPLAPSPASVIPRLSYDLLHPTPLISTWIDWVLGNAHRKQPELTLLAACSGIGCAIGRKLTWLGSHANLYGLGLAESGSGKDIVLHSVRETLTESGFGDTLGANMFGSDAGIIDEVTSHSQIVWCLDEFNTFLKMMSKVNAPAYIGNIGAILLQLYSCRSYTCKALKGVTPSTIRNPYPCIFGVAQPAIFQKVFTEEMIEDGFLGRFVVFRGENGPALEEDPLCDPPPPQLLAALRSIGTASTQSHAVAAALEAASPRPPSASIAFTQANKDCNTLFARKYEADAQRVKLSDPLKYTLLTRTGEKAKKFALIHAWSLNPLAPVMTDASIAWGYAIAEYSNKCMMQVLSERTVSPHDDTLKYMKDCIHKHGVKGVTRGELAGLARKYTSVIRDLAIKDLLDAGSIVTRERRVHKTGPASKIYIAAEHIPKE